MRNRQITDAMKMERGCEICGYRNHPAALTFDHLRPEEKYRTRSGNLVHLSDMIKGNRYALATVLQEIEKCRVLCFNCHMETTYNELRTDYAPYDPQAPTRGHRDAQILPPPQMSNIKYETP